MRIPCPHCGPRDVGEFTPLGDAGPVRPDGLDAAPDAMADYVYLRDNPAGPHREFFQHSAGCRTWLVVTRNTRSHEILGVATARDAALARRTAEA